MRCRFACIVTACFWVACGSNDESANNFKPHGSDASAGSAGVAMLDASDGPAGQSGQLGDGAVEIGAAGLAGDASAQDTNAQDMGADDTTGDPPEDPSDGGCVPPAMVCAGECTDITTDRDNCGSCSHSCAVNQLCTGMLCKTCPAHTKLCSGKCQAILDDAQNCGACGTVCHDDQSCRNISGLGVCKCRYPAAACAGVCVNRDYDPKNCGTCGHACPAACAGGACVTACPAGTTSCPSGGLAACVSVSSDPLNCGACGHVCPVSELCVAANCVPYAPAVDCAACPCPCNAILGASATCCPALFHHVFATCVAGSSCP